MHITIECLQCGGDIVFDEELEVICCPYCSSHMQISGKTGLPSFMLLPRWTVSECSERIMTVLRSRKSLPLEQRSLKLIYAPYWRCKGMVFHWALGKKEGFSQEDGRRTWDDDKILKTKAFDFSFPAYKNHSLGLDSLGIRTSAVQLRLFHPSRLSGSELVLPAEVSSEEANKYSNSFLTFGFSDGNFKVEIEDTELVGETYSLVYFPFWLLEVSTGHRRGLLIIDGLANRVTRTSWQHDLSTLTDQNHPMSNAGVHETLQLIPNRCPVCGWDFPLSPHSKIHVCPTCTRGWQEQHGRYRELEYELVSVPRDWQQPVHYLPFWDLETRIHASREILQTRADLARLAPGLAVGSDAQYLSSPIRFLIPAFKINSMPSFQKLATLFSVRPPEGSYRAKERLEKERFEGVYLAGGEAREMAQVVLFSLVPIYNRRARLLLKDIRLESQPPRLVYYPFFRNGLYLREVNSDHAIEHGTVALNSRAETTGPGAPGGEKREKGKKRLQ
jgi:hypothetical protein